MPEQPFVLKLATERLSERSVEAEFASLALVLQAIK
jgi:hypothetical protein